MKNPIICFIGLDGSGKSTCIDYAYKQLRNRGIKVEIVRAAYVIKVMSIFIKLGKKLLLKKNSNPYSGNYKTYLETLRKQSQKRGVYKIFSLLTTFEFKVQILINIRIKHLLGAILLVDRYIYDNAVTYAANLGLGENYLAETISGKWKYAPKPDLILYIRTPIEVCCSRKDDIPDPLYLEVREPLYDAISKMFPTKIISGDKDKQVMLEEVMRAVNPLIK